MTAVPTWLRAGSTGNQLLSRAHRPRSHSVAALVRIYSANLLTSGLSLLAGVYVSRLLGVHGRGRYTLLVQIGALLVAICSAGLADSVIMAAGGRSAHSNIRSLALSATKLCTVVSIPGAVIVVYACLARPDLLSMSDCAALMVILLTTTLTQLLYSELRLAQLYTRLAICLVAMPLGFLASCLAVGALGRPVAVEDILWSNAVATCAVLGIALSCCRGIPQSTTRIGAPNRTTGPSLMRTWRANYLGNLVTLDTVPVDILVLGAIQGASAVGLYSVALSVGSVIRLQGTAGRLVLLPKFADGMATLNLSPRRVAYLLLGLVMPAAILTFASQFLVPALYGRSFALPTSLVMGALTAAAVSVIRAIAADYLRARRRLTAVAVVSVLSVVLALPTYFGGAALGPIGVAWSVVALEILQFGILYFIIRWDRIR
jgi:O-antigen/teichoic acid export membrane protein